jgi:hypothetical protein
VSVPGVTSNNLYDPATSLTSHVVSPALSFTGTGTNTSEASTLSSHSHLYDIPMSYRTPFTESGDIVTQQHAVPNVGTNFSWNEEFQSIIEEITSNEGDREGLGMFYSDTEEKKELENGSGERMKTKLQTYRNLMKLSQDFVNTSTMFGKIIISEKGIDNDKKTIKPINIGGVAGGEKYIVGGILFKFATDKYKIFGGNIHNAQKVALNELKGLQHFFWRGIQVGLHFPLMCIIDYLGHRLIASSFLPIDNTTICYGCNNAGSMGSIHSSNSDLSDRMSLVASSLNLKGHWIGKDKERRIYTKCPVDLEGHLSKIDNRFYAIDFARVFPPETPKPFPGSHLCNQLRPSLVLTSKFPLCSDAFMNSFLSPHSDVKSEIEVCCICMIIFTYTYLHAVE